MSFVRYKDVIEYGDTVIIYLGYENMLQFIVEKGKIHQTKFGALKHDELVGVQYGSKITCSKGYAYALHPTPELWTVNLPHRTQIIYSTDISLIALQLELRPGCKVIEAGTGSGSLSHAILRAIAPDGHLYTFDFHEQRVAKARAEFAAHGFQDLVTIAHRDVCSNGFDIEDASVDAVFLDLPSPWLAIPFAAKALVPGGRLCTFSPCTEQVQRSCSVMRQFGFSDVTMLECLHRPCDIRTAVMSMPDLGYGPGSYFSSSKQQLMKCKPVVGHVEIDGNQSAVENVQTAPVDDCISNQVADDIDNDTSAVGKYGDGSRTQKTSKASYICKTGTFSSQLAGHTGFLTFATLYPK